MASFLVVLGACANPADEPSGVRRVPVGAAAASVRERPDILLISIDSLRADHVGVYGYAPPTTPVIDDLAASGAVFLNALSTTSWTLPSHVAMLTGRYDRAHGVTAPTRTLGEAVPTLAQVFSDAGYRTVGLYSGPFLHPQFGMSRGFDEYVDSTSYRLASRGTGANRKAHADSHDDVTNPNIVWSFLDTLSRAGDAPLFYFVHMWDVHYDLIPPPPFDRMFDPDYDDTYSGHDFRHDPKFTKGMPEAHRRHVLALYDGEIRYTDTTVGLLLDTLRAVGRLDDVIVVVTSDHGEEFLEHGRKGHKQTLYQEVLRVPLVFAWPGRIAPEREDRAVSIADIAPTLLSLAGLPQPPGMTGRALFSARGAPASRELRPILSELFGRNGEPLLSSVVYRDSKVIAGPKMKEPVYFDLRADPEELDPKAASESELGRELMKMLADEIAAADELRERTPAEGRSRDVELTEDVDERLRALGYLD